MRPAWSPPGDACPVPFTARLLAAGPVIRASGLPSGHGSRVSSRVGTRGLGEAEQEGAWRPPPSQGAAQGWGLQRGKWVTPERWS